LNSASNFLEVKLTFVDLHIGRSKGREDAFLGVPPSLETFPFGQDALKSVSNTEDGSNIRLLIITALNQKPHK